MRWSINNFRRSCKSSSSVYSRQTDLEIKNKKQMELIVSLQDANNNLEKIAVERNQEDRKFKKNIENHLENLGLIDAEKDLIIKQLREELQRMLEIIKQLREQFNEKNLELEKIKQRIKNLDILFP